MDFTDPYVKYGAIAAGGILLYMLMQKQGLGDSVKGHKSMVLDIDGEEINVGPIHKDYVFEEEVEDDTHYWAYENGTIRAIGSILYDSEDRSFWGAEQDDVPGGLEKYSKEMQKKIRLELMQTIEDVVEKYYEDYAKDMYDPDEDDY